MEDKTAVLVKYNNPYDAYIIKGMLETNGVIAGVIEDTTATTLMGNQDNGAVRVIVFERDLERARRLLSEAQLGDPAGADGE